MRFPGAVAAAGPGGREAAADRGVPSRGGRPAGRGTWSSVGRTAVAKVVVMGVSGLFGLVNTRLIIGHFGTDAYAQYGLLATFPNLMPFTDLGIGAVILNAVAGSADPARDSLVRRTITTAIRVLLCSALVIATAGVVVGLLGLWPSLLGARLMEGGGRTATLCLLVYAAALPLSVGQRVVIGLGRSATQVISQGVVSPAMTCMLLAAVVTRTGAGNAVSVYSYLANVLVSVICVVVAWRATSPLLREAVRDVPRVRSVRGVSIRGTAGPQLVQSLVIPLAFQTDRLLLSHLGAPDALAQYNLAATLFNLLTQTVMVTGVAMWPLFARARADRRTESPFRPAAAFAGAGLLAALLLAGATPWAARVLSDGEIALPVVLVGAYVLYVAVEAAKQPLGMYMTDPRGLQFQVGPVLVLVPVNLALSWLLITPMGAAGPIVGSLVSVVLCQILPYAWWVRRDLRRRRAGWSGSDGALDGPHVVGASRAAGDDVGEHDPKEPGAVPDPVGDQPVVSPSEESHHDHDERR
ncbi:MULTISPECIES: oligosaccharide flippase family protein [Actinomyces]|nr:MULTISPECIES: oligosaccharide flippase family protein [Actinomyces]